MLSMNIDLEYYKIFYYVGSLGKISLAAQKLCISQPAVSQAVKHLETQLGTKLFIRTPKGVRLTTEGEVLFSYIKQGYEYILLGEKKFKEMLDLESGEIRIGASDMTLKYYLLPFLEKFHKEYPNIKVSVTNAPTPETIQYLETGKIDFGIISEPFQISKDMVVKPVKEIEDVFVAGSQFDQYRGKKLEFSDLEHMPIICLENNTSTRTYVDDFLLKKNVILRPEFELAMSDIIVQFSIRNMGIGSIVRSFAQKYIQSGELFELEFKEKIPKRRICIATSKKIPVTNAAEKLLQAYLKYDN